MSALCSRSTSSKLGSFLKVQTDRLRDTGITGVLIVSAPCSSSTSIKLGSFLKVQTDRLRNTGITCVSCPPRAPVVPLTNWGLCCLIGGSCHKYHFCPDKTRLLSRQNYVCRDINGQFNWCVVSAPCSNRGPFRGQR